MLDTKQVCSVTLAKKIGRLGVKGKSYFIWAKSKEEVVLFNPTEWSDYTSGNEEFIANAFTVAELGEILPFSIKSKATNNEWWDLIHVKCVTGEWADILVPPSYRYKHREIANTEANARAKMLIYLLENKLIEVPKQWKS